MHLLKEGFGLETKIGDTAQWSLTSNALQHDKVYAICKEELKTEQWRNQKNIRGNNR